jgi:PAS domain S-box-containing protein
MAIDDIEQRQAMLAAIIDSSEDAIISKDLNSRITSWNKAAERMFGYSEQEMLGEHVHKLIPRSIWSEEDMIISNLKAGRRIEHYQTVRATKSGRLIHVSLTVSPIRNSLGIITGASKIARDITRQKQDEELIRQYASRLEIINSMTKTISAQLDVQTILQKVTDTTTQLCGAAFGAFFYNKVDSKGESYMLFTLSGAPREAFEKFGMPRNTEIFRQTFDGAGVLRSPDITKDPRYGKNAPYRGMPQGHLPVVSYLAVPMRSQSGVVMGGLFFGHPEPGMFTEEHEHLVVSIASQGAIALDNAKLYEEVQALNSQKDEFIGFASHELKTPLTTMSGYVQLARQTAELPDQFVEKIGKQVNRLQRIVSDLLDISKIQAGRLDLQFEKSSLHAMIRESIETINPEDRPLELEMPPEDLWVTMDSQKMSQVVINLLSNAIKYSAAGTAVGISVMRLGDEIRITIRDQGVGIATQHLDKIFNQFYRVDKKQKIPGIGLGLYIARQIVEGHLGRIWAESEEGTGSAFHVLFPIERRPGGTSRSPVQQNK